MASRFQPPPIVDAARNLCADIEQVVRKFPRYHRYQSGAALRLQAETVMRCATRTWQKQDQRRFWADKLVDAIDDLKDRLQVCKLVRAYQSFAQFERLMVRAGEIGKQAGGWKRSLDMHPHAQNVQAEASAQRGKKLSTRAARSRANA
ncbi:MAG: hypothetical protein ABS82_01185 [Rhodanobacter sp. SCN 67-45]|nr:MAG: hypothetical protein ABS82_01185 [Rhodanobacter sp. SCN 67-45]